MSKKLPLFLALLAIAGGMLIVANKLGFLDGSSEERRIERLGAECLEAYASYLNDPRSAYVQSVRFTDPDERVIKVTIRSKNSLGAYVPVLFQCTVHSGSANTDWRWVIDNLLE